jgi:serine protease AprX
LETGEELDQVKARLMKTASKTFPAYTSYTDPTMGITYTTQYDVFTIGAGYLRRRHETEF